MKKRILSLLCAGAMLCGLAACGTSTGDKTGDNSGNNEVKSEYADQTLVGQVTSIGDNTLTLLLGELADDAP